MLEAIREKLESGEVTAEALFNIMFTDEEYDGRDIFKVITEEYIDKSMGAEECVAYLLDCIENPEEEEEEDLGEVTLAEWMVYKPSVISFREEKEYHERLDKLFNICSGTKEEINREFDAVMECGIIHDLLADGKNKSEIGRLLYPGLTRDRQKVNERIQSQMYQRMFR